MSSNNILPELQAKYVVALEEKFSLVKERFDELKDNYDELREKYETVLERKNYYKAQGKNMASSIHNYADCAKALKKAPNFLLTAVTEVYPDLTKAIEPFQQHRQQVGPLPRKQGNSKQISGPKKEEEPELMILEEMKEEPIVVSLQVDPLQTMEIVSEPNVPSSTNPRKKANKSHTCESCDKTFRSLKNRSRHFKLVHTERTRSSCTMCDKDFSRRDTLNIHVRKHHSSGPVELLCPTCGFTFDSKSNLKDHTDGGCPEGSSTSI